MSELDIHLSIEVQVPQLDTLTQALVALGEKLVETVESIIATVQQIQASQEASSAALTEQVTRIADEVAQWEASAITQQQIDNLGAALKTIAADSEAQTQKIQANTQAIQDIIPDTPTP